jgi:hypothetical protein
MCCDAKKAEKEVLYSCEAGIDSILQTFQIEYTPMGYIEGVGYIDGHCLDSENALLLYQDGYTVLEYGNFKKGYYMVDSAVLPLFDFETFNNSQQIVWQNLSWRSENPIIKWMLKGPASLTSIYPYKGKIFGTGPWGFLIVMDIQEKSFEFFEPSIYYSLFDLVEKKYSIHFDLLRIKNDTLILSRRQSEDGFLDTLLVTLDGENVIPKIKDSRCLEISFENRKREYFGDKKRCFDH